MKTEIEQQKAALDNEFAYHNGTKSELEKLTSEFGGKKESHAATLSGSQSLTAESKTEVPISQVFLRQNFAALWTGSLFSLVKTS